MSLGVVLLGVALAVVAVGVSWFVARLSARREARVLRAEVAALRAELAGALERISSREEAAAILARVEEVKAEAEDAERRKGRRGLFLINGGLVVGAIGAAASAVAREAKRHPTLAAATTATAVTTASITSFTLLGPSTDDPPRRPDIPPRQAAPERPTPAPERPEATRTPAPKPGDDSTQPKPGRPDARPTQPDSSDKEPEDLEKDSVTPTQPPEEPGRTPPSPPDSSPPAQQPEPQPTPPEPEPEPEPEHGCTIQVGELVCVDLQVSVRLPDTHWTNRDDLQLGKTWEQARNVPHHVDVHRHVGYADQPHVRTASPWDASDDVSPDSELESVPDRADLSSRHELAHEVTQPAVEGERIRFTHVGTRASGSGAHLDVLRHRRPPDLRSEAAFSQAHEKPTLLELHREVPVTEVPDR
jgi:hypothetical protein